MFKNSKVIYPLIVVLSLVTLSFVLNRSEGHSAFANTYDGPSMKGLCWVAGDSIADHNINQISAIGANWISQTPFGWMEGHQSPVVVGNFDRAWWGETDKGIGVEISGGLISR